MGVFVYELYVYGFESPFSNYDQDCKLFLETVIKKRTNQVSVDQTIENPVKPQSSISLIMSELGIEVDESLDQDGCQQSLALSVSPWLVKKLCVQAISYL